MTSLDQATTFDLAAVSEQSVDNPVFYVQMASARIGGVGRKAVERGVERAPLAEVDLSLLTHQRELELIRCLEELPEVVADAAVDRAPTKVTTWVRRLAACFHGFYHDCPILADGVDPALAQARLWLVGGDPDRTGHRPRPPRRVGSGGDVTDAEYRPAVAPGGCDPTDPVAPSLLPMTAAIGPTGRLSVGGVDLVDLAEEFGTPLFVYDEAHLRARCREAVEAWGDGVAYATKAFLCLAMARLAHEEGMCLDVSTGGELHVALTAGVPAYRLVLHGNNKSEDELASALEVGRGSDRGRLLRRDRPHRAPAPDPPAQAAEYAAGPPKVLARITPGVEVHTHEFVRTGQDDSKFGFGLASGAAAAPWTGFGPPRQGDRRVRGIHAHSGARSSPWPRSPRPSTCWPSSSPRSACPSWWWVAVSAWPMSTARRRRPWPSGPPRCAGRAAGRHPRLGPGHRRAGAVHRGCRRASPSTGWGRSRTSPATGPTSRWTGG